ncbi:MAG TPA: hypothetical protein VJ183_19360 [Chloroflexia bacterium]|nr:hypothetical protein [Chloroflexia bacterium]
MKNEDTAGKVGVILGLLSLAVNCVLAVFTWQANFRADEANAIARQQAEIAKEQAEIVKRQADLAKQINIVAEPYDLSTITRAFGCKIDEAQTSVAIFFYSTTNARIYNYGERSGKIVHASSSESESSKYWYTHSYKYGEGSSPTVFLPIAIEPNQGSIWKFIAERHDPSGSQAELRQMYSELYKKKVQIIHWTLFTDNDKQITWQTESTLAMAPESLTFQETCNAVNERVLADLSK